MADNLGSCWIARAAFEGELLLLNGDTVFEPAIVQRLRACAAFLLDRELPVDAGPERRWITANPWLQVALDRQQRMQ